MEKSFDAAMRAAKFNAELAPDYEGDSVIDRWLAACCVFDPKATSKSTDLYQSFMAYCAGQGCAHLAGIKFHSAKSFAGALRNSTLPAELRGGPGAAGYTSQIRHTVRKVGGKSVRFIAGIRLLW